MIENYPCQLPSTQLNISGYCADLPVVGTVSSKFEITYATIAVDGFALIAFIAFSLFIGFLFIKTRGTIKK